MMRLSSVCNKCTYCEDYKTSRCKRLLEYYYRECPKRIREIKQNKEVQG